MPLIGREREQAILADRLAAAARGIGSVALVSGEPGVGKSRLLDALAADAQSAGAIVLRGAASDAAGMPPYLPFIEALERPLRETPDLSEGLDGNNLAGPLAALFPDLAARLPGHAGAARLPPEQERYRLFEAVGGLLDAVAGDALLVLILDDLQWADASTLDLLCALGRRQSSRRLLVAGAFRESDAEDHSALSRAMAELSRLRVLTTIAVAPLDPDEIARLAAAALGEPLGAASVAMLAERSGGNPFFAEELLRHWQDTGALAPGADGARVDASPDDVPLSIRATVRLRLDGLRPEAADLLRTAAIVGRSADVALLALTVGIDPEQVERLLLDGVRAHLVRLTADGGLHFSHDTVREALVGDLPPTRRRRLHGLTAQAIEQLAGTHAERRAAEIAFHYVRGEDRPRAQTWSRKAAAQSLRAAAFSDAAAHLHNALAAASGDEPDLGQLLLAKGEAEIFADDPAAANTLSRAADWFRAHAQNDQVVRSLRLLGHAHARRERHADALIAFETALTSIPDGDGRDRIETLVDLGTLLAASLHDHDRARDALEQANQLAAAANDRGLRARALRALGNLRVRQGDLDEGIGLLESALAIAEEIDDPAEAAECCACLAPAWFWRGELERSAAITRRRLEHASRTRDPYQLRHVYTWLAICSGIRGRIDEAHRWIDRAAAQVEAFASPEPAAFLEFVRGALAVVQGDNAEGRRRLGSAIERFRAIGPGALVWYLGWLGIAYAQLAEVDLANETLAELEGLLAAMPSEEAPGEALALLVQSALLLDDRRRLERHAPALWRLGGRFHDALVDRLLGEIRLRSGELDEAATLLAAAETVARRERMPYELARTLEAKAALALRRDRAEEAKALLGEAATVLERVGCLPRAARLRARADETATRERDPLPAKLTRREREVLRGIAAGRSNREIAADLFLSEKTIERHVGNVYAKIGVENRASATAFAIRHGIA